MADQENPDRNEEGQDLIPPDSHEHVPAESSKPTAPRDMPDDENEMLRKRAEKLVEQLAGATGSNEMELMDNVSLVGTQVQRSGAAELDLLRRRVGDMLSEGGGDKDISDNLVDLRLTLGQINPDELRKPGTLRRLLGVVPFVGRTTPALQILQKIAIRYEPVSRQIEIVEAKLRQGRMMLTKDNVELRHVYEQVEAQQFPIQKNAYLGELLMVELRKLLERTDETLKGERIRNALHDVSMRVQDLRTMEQAYAQFFVGIDMTRQNNTRLGQAVERTLTVATNIVMVGLAIQAALSRQKQIAEATQRTRAFIGDMLAANAKAIKKHTEEIGEVYNNPVIALEKMSQAHDDLLSAMDAAASIKQEGIELARENIAKLSLMSAQMQQKVGDLPAPEKSEPVSIEA